MSRPRPTDLEPALTLAEAASLAPPERARIIALCSLAFDEDFGSLFDLLGGATHLLAHLDGQIVGHACWVTRRLQPAGLPMLKTAYVEAVATHPDLQGRGVGSAVMRRIHDLIRPYDLGALSPAHPRFYARLGWEPWRGPLAIRTDDGLLPTPDEEVMIRRTPRTPPLDLDTMLTAEWRVGELW
jgi:aminoglycoside 2'-N-acetyltransferase I